MTATESTLDRSAAIGEEARQVREGADSAVPQGRILWHVAAYLVLLLIVAWFTNTSSPFMSDDGAYASQVELMAEGDWGYRIAPEWGTPPQELQTLGKSTLVDGIEYPYIKHPAWIYVLRTADLIDPPLIGMALFNALAAVGAAWVATRLVDRDRRAQIWAFWAVALGPVLVWGVGVWAHATAALLGGTVAWCLCRWRTGLSLRWMLGAALAASALSLIRTEGALMVVAAGVVVIYELVRRWRDRRELFSVIVAGLLMGGAAVAARVLDAVLIHEVAPGTATFVPGPGEDWLYGRWTGFEATFLSGGFNPLNYSLGLFALVLVAIGIALRTRASEPGLGDLLLGVGVAMFALRALTGVDGLIPGLFAASPVLLFAVASRRWSSLSEREKTLAILVIGFMALVTATQYSVGGATEWGGRFLAPVVVPLAALAAVGIRGLADAATSPAQRRWVLVAAALLIVIPVLPSQRSTITKREIHASITQDLLDAKVDAAIATLPTVPLLLWPTIPTTPWTVTSPRSSYELVDVVKNARRAGETRIAVVGYTVDPKAVEGLGFKVQQRSPHLLVLTATP